MYTLSLTQIFGLKLLVLALFQWLSLGSSPLIVAATKWTYVVTMVTSPPTLAGVSPMYQLAICVLYLSYPLFGLLADVWIGRNNAIHGGMGLCLYQVYSISTVLK